MRHGPGTTGSARAGIRRHRMRRRFDGAVGPVFADDDGAVGGDAILFRAASFVEPGAWYRYDPATNKTSRTGLFSAGRG